MTDRQQREALFLDNLGAIERIAGALCRRHGLAPEEAADFASWTRLKLVEDDYAVLAKFRGESAITTYLTVVIAMLFRDYRVKHWGRWRPSAAALRRGPLAVRLETLMHRDGLSLTQAAESLRTSGATTLGDRELAALLVDVPMRLPLRPVDAGPAALDDRAADDRADRLVESADMAEERRCTAEALERVMASLAPEDQIVLRLRFWEGLSIADVARALQVEQKPLYRRIERALKDVRVKLEAAGISRERARALLGEDAA